MVTLRRGERLGRYRVESPLATGGFAKIYRGFDTVQRRRVALKVPATRYPDETWIADFRREVAENRKLRHPLVLPVTDSFVERGFPVLVMPLGRGSLAERMKRRLPLRQVLRYAHDMLVALAYAHRKHELHLDVKPENLIVLASGRLALADFGTARRGHRTVVGDRAGTEGYMAPEQAAGRPSARSDVYAAGVVIREMLSGVGPEGSPPRRHTVARQLLEIVERATDPDPRRRYPDAAAMLADLRKLERRIAARGSR